MSEGRLTHVTISARSIMWTFLLWVIEHSGQLWMLPASDVHTNAKTHIFINYTSEEESESQRCRGTSPPRSHSKCTGETNSLCCEQKHRWRKHRGGDSLVTSTKTSHETHYTHESCAPINFYVIKSQIKITSISGLAYWISNCILLIYVHGSLVCVSESFWILLKGGDNDSDFMNAKELMLSPQRVKNICHTTARRRKSDCVEAALKITFSLYHSHKDKYLRKWDIRGVCSLHTVAVSLSLGTFVLLCNT